MLPPMFMVSEADAAAIRAVFDADGEFSAAIEFRRRFPAVTDNAHAAECARTIAWWRPIVLPMRFTRRRRKGVRRLPLGCDADARSDRRCFFRQRVSGPHRRQLARHVDSTRKGSIISGSRAAAEGRYRELRRAAFRAAEAQLSAAGIAAELRGIDVAAVAFFAGWRSRRVQWPWPDMAAEWRRNFPERFDLAAWQGGILCALALGRPSRGASHMALHYVEGNPDPAHPLRREVVPVVLAALQAYAIALGKAELRLVDPLPALIPFYCSPALGFELVTPRREATYCCRRI